MIVVRLMGGLGNQMFQYAAGRRLAHKHNTTLKIDRSWLDIYQSPDAPALREYELDCFVLPQTFARKTDLARIVTPSRTLRRRIYQSVTRPISTIVENETADFMPNLLKASDNTYLEGFWQSDEYFKDAEDVIRRDFRFRHKPTGKNLSLANAISQCDAVSVHVRRGDYASHKEITAFHGLTGLDYYTTAAAQIIKKVPNAHFFVFSDDPAWCKKNLKLPGVTTFIDHNTKGSEDLRLMSLCSHNIIANSSFSWWGAWLNDNPHKVVYAPKKWFNDPSMSTKNRLPADWIQL